MVWSAVLEYLHIACVGLQTFVKLSKLTNVFSYCQTGRRPATEGKAIWLIHI